MFWYNNHNNITDDGLERAICDIVLSSLCGGAVILIVGLIIIGVKFLITGE